MKISSHQPKIVVVGSCSIDLILNTPQNLIIGETIMATQSESFFGGKGANEAVAVARLGADAYFVGCVGMDPMGQQIMHHLVDEKVNVGYVTEISTEPTGGAYVLASNEENTIVVDAAANKCLNAKAIAKAEKHFESADFILVQLEIPLDAVEYTVQLAKKYNKKIGLYASPGKKISSKIIEDVDFIIMKKRGVEFVFEESLSDELLRKYPNKLFVREENKTTFYNGSEIQFYEDNSLDVIHKMGMGDAFVASFTIALCHHNTIDDAVKFGNHIALRVSQERGSQKGLPHLEEISEFFK